MLEKKRIRYFDIAKGITILCVIIGHFGIASINQVVFSFHMPLFFIISGYFLKTEGDFKKFVKQKAKQLIWPYVITVLAVSIGAMTCGFLGGHTVGEILGRGWNWVKAGIYGAGSSGNGLPEGIWPIGAIWFLLALFFAMVEVRFFSKIKYGFFIILLIAYFSSLLRAYVWLPFSVQMGALCAIFVFFGKKAHDEEVFSKKIPLWAKGIGVIIWGLYIAYCGVFSAVQGVLTNGLLDLFVPAIGTYFVIELSRVIEKRTCYLSTILEFYGKNTLIILCAHLFELNVFPWDRIWPFLAEECHFGFFTQVWIIIVFKVIWATMAVWVIKHIPVLRDIFQGKGIPALSDAMEKAGNNVQQQKNCWRKAVMGVSILLMILGNEVVQAQGSGLIYSVAISMLFILLGMKLRDDWQGTEVRNGIKYLLLPYLGFAVITFIIEGIYFIKGEQGGQDVYHCLFSLIGGMNAASRHFNSVGTVSLIWIFPCMFLSLVIFKLGSILLRKSNSEVKAFWGILCSLAGCALGVYYAFMIWTADVSAVMVVFLVLGAWLQSRNFSGRAEWLVILISGVIVFDLSFFGVNFDVFNRDYSAMPFGIVLGLAAGVFGICIIKQLCKINCVAIVGEKAGRFSAIIFLLYYVELRAINWMPEAEEYINVELTPYRAWIIRICVWVIFALLYVIFRKMILLREKNNDK